jgi:hypothetical protein
MGYTVVGFSARRFGNLASTNRIERASPDELQGTGLLVRRSSTSRQFLPAKPSPCLYKMGAGSTLVAARATLKDISPYTRKGFLHRGISINNLVINKDDNTRSWPSFLIYHDLAIKKQREGASGAQGKISMRTFIAIGAFLGK